MVNAYKYAGHTEKIIGAAIKVHNTLGCGFQEVIYQRALAIELNFRSIDYKREFAMEIFYKNNMIGTRRVDFLIDDKIAVEIKARTCLEDVHLAQAKNYLEAFNLEIGLLINFGAKSLEFKRIINNKIKSQADSPISPKLPKLPQLPKPPNSPKS